ncbi:MAG: NYN domain-containing protein, partial [Nanoarchaeota archaeon]
KPTDEEKIRKEKYDNFIDKLKENPIIEIKEGRCQRIKLDNGNYEYNQKGVDTFLTMDLMTIPLKYQKIKKIILIACDSDFVPVIKEINGYGIKTILFTYYEKGRKRAFSTSNQLFQVVSKYVLIEKKDFINSKFEKIEVK